MKTVHFRINDVATGKPTPCRIRITDAQGVYHPPLGRLARFAHAAGADVGGNLLLDGKEYSYIDGTCEVPLPSGAIDVEIHKGPEYTPIRGQIPHFPGKVSLRFEMQRWIDLRSEGWYSGDTSAFHLSPHAALLEGAAEDLAVVNLLALAREEAIPNLLAFSGQKPALEMPGHMVVVNTLNVADDVKLALLNSHRVIYPLTFSGDEWTLKAWCDQCHRKGGLVVWHGSSFASPPTHDINAFEVNELTREQFDRWYHLLQSGMKLPLVGGSGKDSNARLLGGVRTYAHLEAGQELTYKNWIEAVRAGRTFVTNGPLLKFDVNVDTLRVSATVSGPADHLEIIADGRVVAYSTSGSIDEVIPVGQARWLAARCWSDSESAAAHTSAVFLTRPN